MTIKLNDLYFGENSQLIIHPQEYTPTACVAAGPAAGGSVTAGAHSYKYTLVTPEGESLPSLKSNPITTETTNLTINLSGIIIGSARCTSRKIYRTDAGADPDIAANYKLIATIANNTDTTYPDTSADGAGAVAPTLNTTSNVLKSAVTGGTNATALTIDTDNTYADGYLLKFKNNNSIAMYLHSTSGFRVYGNIRTDNDCMANRLGTQGGDVRVWNTNTSMQLLSHKNDASNAYGFKFAIDADATAFTTAGSKLVAYYNDAAINEKGYVDKDGSLGVGQNTPLLITPQEYANTKLTVGTATAGGSVDDGVHSYKYTFVTPEGESLPSTVSSNATTGGGNNTVALSAILPGTARCTARNIYRNSIAVPATYRLLATISDNSTTTASDAASDASIAAAAVAPTVNTTSNVFKSSVADSATAIGHVFDTNTSYSTAGSKIASFKNFKVEKASIGSDGDIRVGGISALPVASATYRGALWVVQGGAGVDDTLYVCLKKGADGSYNWVSIATGA